MATPIGEAIRLVVRLGQALIAGTRRAEVGKQTLDRMEPDRHRRRVSRLLDAQRAAASTQLEGMIAEYRVGLRSTFDVFYAQQLLRDAEAFVHTLKRDYVRVSPLSDARTALALLAGWIEDYNTNHHPRSGLKMRSTREHRAAGSTNA